MKRNLKDILKMAGTMAMVIMAAVLVVAGLELGSRTVKYTQRGFTVQKAIAWTSEEQTSAVSEAIGIQPETDNPYAEREIQYTINQNVDVVACVDLGKR